MMTNQRTLAEMLDLGDYVTTEGAAQISGYKISWIRQLLQNGKIKATKVGQIWLVEKSSLQAYADEMKLLGSEKHDPTRGRQ